MNELGCAVLYLSVFLCTHCNAEDTFILQLFCIF